MAKNSIDLGIDFEIDIAESALNIDYDILRIGVKKNQMLKDSAYEEALKTLPGGLMGNIKDSDDFLDEGATVSTADSFKSVWLQTPLLKYFRKLLNANGNVLVNCWYRSHDAQARKNASNSTLALLRQAYSQMAKELMSKPKRAAMKGHDFFAIGTGQTYMSMVAEVIETKKKD